MQAFIDAMPIIKAQESLSRINEVMYATGNMRNPDSYIRAINRLATTLEDKSAATLDLSKMTPEQRRMHMERLGFRVVK